MALAKPEPTPKQRIIADRARRAKPHHLARGWRAVAEEFAARHGLNEAHVLDLFDERAMVRLYGGEDWATAQANAWDETVELLNVRVDRTG